MEQKKYRALLFDVMSTLVYEPFFKEVPDALGIPMQELLPQLHPRAWVDFECALIDEGEFVARFFRDGRAFDHEGMKAAMIDAYQWLEGTETLLNDLRNEGYALHLFSNYPEWYQLIEDKLGLSRYAPWSFVSCHTGIRKPDAEAYLLAARTLDLPPSSLLFIDDREENCEAARAVGMDAIVFHTTARLREELSQRGVLAA